MSALQLTPDTIPEQKAYLSAEPERAANWKARLGNSGFKVGILWRGNTQTSAVSLTDLSPLADIPGARLISLQKNPGARQVAQVPFGDKIECVLDENDLSPESLLDTAAVMANLDVIVSIDSMPAHLAGALGTPVLLALSYVPDWRWLTERHDTPWYPGTKLFRQGEDRNWVPVFGRIAAAIRKKVALGNGGSSTEH